MTDYNFIKVEDLKKINLEQATIIDVRTKMEQAEISLVADHKQIELTDLNPEDLIISSALNLDNNIYLLCKSGGRAEKAAKKFIDAGYRNIFVIEGGITECNKLGMATKSDNDNKIKIPLERQVRIGAGIIIIIGALLSLTLSNIFSIIPIIVGCGLIYAGITDKCGFALILTKAPWNKIDNDLS